MSDTATVKVWSGSRFDSYDDVMTFEPEEYEMNVVDSEFGSEHEASEEERVYLSEDIQHHGTYAFDVESDVPLVLNIHSNDSYHAPDEWGEPIERGLPFSPDDDYGAFKCEIWGRIMMWVDKR